MTGNSSRRELDNGGIGRDSGSDELDENPGNRKARARLFQPLENVIHGVTYFSRCRKRRARQHRRKTRR